MPALRFIAFLVGSHGDATLFQLLHKLLVHIRRHYGKAYFIESHCAIGLGLKIACAHPLDVLYNVRYLISSFHRYFRIKPFQVFVYAFSRMGTGYGILYVSCHVHRIGKTIADTRYLYIRKPIGDAIPLGFVLRIVHSPYTLSRLLADLVNGFILFLCGAKDAAVKQSLTATCSLPLHSIDNRIKSYVIIQLLPLTTTARWSEHVFIIPDSLLLHHAREQVFQPCFEFLRVYPFVNFLLRCLNVRLCLPVPMLGIVDGMMYRIADTSLGSKWLHAIQINVIMLFYESLHLILQRITSFILNPLNADFFQHLFIK